MIYSLEPFQKEFVDEVIRQVFKYKSVIAQAETGSGKTVMFANISHRYINSFEKDVIIFVDRDKLLEQTRKTIYNWYDIVASRIDADVKTIEKSRVYVAMVETFDRRADLTHFIEIFKNVGLVIFDEAHLGNFKKLFQHFPDALKIGFTATPISASKKEPLKLFYNSIVIGPTPQELIAINDVNPLRGITRCHEYSMQNISRGDLKINSKGEFDEVFMGKVFIKQIQNTLDAYIQKSFGKKTICFNASVEHSYEVHQAFLSAGFNSRHLNGPSSDPRFKKYGSKEYRRSCYEWLANEKDAILNNVGVATTGFDDPSIETVITNSSIMSKSMFRQKRGRGGRPYQYPDGTYKKHFTHIDMGDNIVGGNHGEWHDEVPWKDIFENPKQAKAGIAAIKACPECGAINHASARVCKGRKEDFFEGEIDCGFMFPVTEEVEDITPKEIVLITKSIDVKQNIEFFKDRNEFYSYHEGFKQIANLAKQEITELYMDADKLFQVYSIAYIKAKEWFKLRGRRRYSNFKEDVLNKVIEELKNVGFMVAVEEIEKIDVNEGVKTTTIDNRENPCASCDEGELKYFGFNPQTMSEIYECGYCGNSVSFP